MALGYPEVGFSLTSGQAGQRAEAVQCPPANGLGERFFQLFGERLDLIELRKEAAGLQIHGYIAALGDQGPVRGSAERLRQPAHRQGPDDRARDYPRPTASRRSRNAARRCTCSSESRRIVWTSTCIRRKRRCGFSSSRWCTKCCAAHLATHLVRDARPSCNSRRSRRVLPSRSR